MKILEILLGIGCLVLCGLAIEVCYYALQFIKKDNQEEWWKK